MRIFIVISLIFSNFILSIAQNNVNLTCPNDLLLDCKEVIPFANYTDFINAGGYASSNCGIKASTFRLSHTISGGKTSIRFYVIEDSCGNFATCQQIITSNDSIKPIIICPPNLTASCISEQPAYSNLTQFIAAGGMVTDNCGINNSSLKLIREVDNGGTCLKVVTRTYQITDLNGNTASCVQTITLNDTIAPTFTRVPANVTANCISEQPPYSSFAQFVSAGGIAMDNCSLDTTSFKLVMEISDGNVCPETITRIYRISDVCGNLLEWGQRITINDQIDPNLICPPIKQVNTIDDLKKAYSSINELIVNGGSVSDNCGIDTASFELIAELIDTTIHPNVVKRTYFISDLCGNEDICLQKISILNSTDIPVINELENFKYTIIPNPNKGIFNFRIDSNPVNDLTLKLVNAVGQVIEIRDVQPTTVNHTEQFDVSYLSKGIYHLVITSNKFQRSEKIVVQ